jgi:hypothetical protein
MLVSRSRPPILCRIYHGGENISEPERTPVQMLWIFPTSPCSRTSMINWVFKCLLERWRNVNASCTIPILVVIQSVSGRGWRVAERAMTEVFGGVYYFVVFQRSCCHHRHHTTTAGLDIRVLRTSANDNTIHTCRLDPPLTTLFQPFAHPTTTISRARCI